MPTFEITSPDGRRFRITAPEGATQDEVMAYARRSIPQQQAAESEDPGALKALAIGAGATADRLAAGLRQGARQFLGEQVTGVIDSLGRAFGMADGSQLESQQAGNARIMAGLREKQPVATMFGEIAPVAAFPALGSGATGIIAGSALPGLIEYGTPEEKLARGGMGALGGAVGSAVGKAIARGLQPTRAGASSVAPEALAAAERVGYQPTAGQVTGSKFLQTLEQQAAKNPFAAKTAQAFNERNAEAMNRAAARAIGEQADNLGEDVMQAAAQRLGAKFDELIAGREIPLGSKFQASAMVLQKRAAQAGEFADPQVAGLADKAMEVAKRGSLTGEEYQAMRSAVTALKRTAAAGNNGPLKGAAKTIQKALDDAAEDALPASVLKEWKTARAQYAAMSTLQKRGAIKAGNVDPAIVRNALASSDRAAFARGNLPGELGDIARIGNAFRPLPDSGTAGNAMAQALLSGGAGLLGPGALATSILAPKAAAKALFSDAGRSYLTHGAGLTPEAEALLLKSLGVPGGLLGLQSTR